MLKHRKSGRFGFKSARSKVKIVSLQTGLAESSYNLTLIFLKALAQTMTLLIHRRYEVGFHLVAR